MWSLLRPGLTLFILLTVITGLLYPAVTTGLGRLLFPDQAAGSLITKDGKLVGSELIGQNFSAPQYFWGRLSATTPNPYNGAASAGSNFGPLNPALLEAVKARIAALQASGATPNTPIPVDLVTASGSGLDPHITPAAAYYQVDRVARARGLNAGRVKQLIDTQTERPWLGFLGEPRVNVLKLNLALDALR
ncbi:MAG TPA: potassium-transporting ATPase subunit KdpC [Phycisphaerae bacterium]|nr:potassium-transporting ATPase subunit KdpC [Phycisphaerae bacterium]